MFGEDGSSSLAVLSLLSLLSLLRNGLALERNGFSVTATWVDEGHRIEPAAFKAWIDQIP